jgi:hypothetical protein
MARQEQDFNKETNRQLTTMVIRGSSRVTIDLVECQVAQVLQLLLALTSPQKVGRPPDQAGEQAPASGMSTSRQPAAELQDVEVNTLLQRQHIEIEDCTDIKVSVSQIEVERILETALELLHEQERRVSEPAQPPCRSLGCVASQQA